jgi:beta-lactamase regulating signal transducer with metallopeptidase domain
MNWNDPHILRLGAQALAMLVEASLIAAFAIAIARVGFPNHPAARHALLASALAALFLTPLLWPLARTLDTPALLKLPDPALDRSSATIAPSAAAAQPTMTGAAPSLQTNAQPASTTHAPISPSRYALPLILILWPLIALLLLTRLVRAAHIARQLLQNAQPLAVDSDLPVFTSPACITPLTLGLFRPVILLPPDLAASLTTAQLRQVLAHESAHLRRKDPLIALTQRIVAAVFWPSPLVHLLNRDLSKAREEVCDNHALAVTADSSAAYAATLLKIATAHGTLARQLAALPLLQRNWSLRDRVAGLLNQRRSTMLRVNRTIAPLCIVCFTAAALFIAHPVSRAGDPPAAGTAAAKDTKDQRPAIVGDVDRADFFAPPPNIPAIAIAKAKDADFKYPLRFHADKGKFAKGDAILITRITSTAADPKPGQALRIEGVYQLASRDTATLAAYITTNVNVGTPSIREQSTQIQKGRGRFVLILPLVVEGDPHLSYYPAEGGESFGGLYFDPEPLRID